MKTLQATQVGYLDASLALPIHTHTEAGVAELVRVDIWRRSDDGRLLLETGRYAIAISRFDGTVILDEAGFQSALGEARQALPSKALPRGDEL